MQSRRLGTPSVWVFIAAVLVSTSGAMPAVWQRFDARLIAAATPQLDAKWFNSLPGPVKPIMAPVITPASQPPRQGGLRATVIVSPDSNFGPMVCTLDDQGGPFQAFDAYALNFFGGVRIAIGNVTTDTPLEIITGPGGTASFGSRVRLFTRPGVGQLLGEGAIFPQTFTGGVFVAMGNVNGGGGDDLIFGVGSGGPPQVRVYSLDGGGLLADFLAFDPGFTGGVRVAAGDINGDGRDEIITGPGPGSPPEVRLFGMSGNDVIDIGRGLVFAPSFTGGVSVAAGDVNGDGRADIIVGGGPNSEPQVRVFSVSGGVSELANFFAYEQSFRGGVKVAAGDVNGDGRAEVITIPGPGRLTVPRAFDLVPSLPTNRYAELRPFGGVFQSGASIAAR